MSEKVEHPKHYNDSDAKCINCQSPIECIEVVQHMGFHLGNVVKYVWRHEFKGGIEDLKKAQFYLNDYIKKMEAYNDRD